MKCLPIIRASTKIIFFVLLSSVLQAQDKGELEAKRAQIQEKILETQELLRATNASQKTTVTAYQAMQAQIDQRKSLLESLQSEVKMIDRQLKQQQTLIDTTTARVLRLEVQYGATLRNAYLIKKTQNPMMFVLSAESFNQALRRWTYIKQLQNYQKKQLGTLNQARDSLNVLIERLNFSKQKKTDILKIEMTQKQELDVEVAATKKMLAGLKEKESALKTELDRNKKERTRLNNEIEKLILAEMENSSNDANLPNAPAMVALTNEFSSNQGKLPWPVRKGLITGKFGEQPHPILRSIKINNNGVDISAERGAPVQAIFDGTVVGLKNIPGFNNMVIIRHGQFYTVYSKLGDVFVSKGDKVNTGQSIGRLSALNADSFSTLHFEVWKEKTQVNPELWLSK